jgi:hypothetical protein
VSKPRSKSKRYSEEQVRLELINMAVLLRSYMIGSDEFLAKARLLGVEDPLEKILQSLPLPTK